MGNGSVSVSVLPFTATVAFAAKSVISLAPGGVAFTVKVDAAGAGVSFIGSLKVIVRVRPFAARVGIVPESSAGATLSARAFPTPKSVKPSASFPARSLMGFVVGLE